MGVETIGFQLTLKFNMQAEMRRRGKFFSIDEIGRRDQHEKKESRIRQLQPLFEQGLVYLRKDMTPIMDELLSFPRGKHDDLIDALSRQLDYLVPSMGKSVPHETKDGTMRALLEKTWKRQSGGSYGYFDDLKEARSFLAS